MGPPVGTIGIWVLLLQEPGLDNRELTMNQETQRAREMMNALEFAALIYFSSENRFCELDFKTFRMQTRTQ